METINHECYVSLEVAKLLKEVGFDWSVMHFYDEFEDGKIPFYSRGAEELQQNMNAFGYYSAPTLEVAQRWLREVKDIDVYIFPTTNNKRGCVYEWGIKTFGRALWVEGQPYTNQYETYEEAQEAGIKKALELILEKGK